METNYQKMPQIDKSMVISVYSGKPGCCCGCLGKYSYAKAHQDVASINRGFKVEDNELNDRSVSIIVNKVNKDLLTAEIEFNQIFVDAGSRWYMVNMFPEAIEKLQEELRGYTDAELAESKGNDDGN